MARVRWYAQSRVLHLMVVLLTAMVALSIATPAWAYGAVHVVQPGESLSQIAVRYGVTMSALAAANGIGNANYIYTGQQLVIPDGSSASNLYSTAGSSYVTVGRGDSLSVIASVHGMSINELMQLNGLTNPNHIWVGQQLLVRGGSGSAAVTDTSYASVMSDGTLHIVQRGDTLSRIAQRYGLSLQQIMTINGISNPNHVYVGQRLLVVGGSSQAGDLTYAPAAGVKRIDVNLSTQTLTAWYGDRVVLKTRISSGTADAPTVTGSYRIGNKYTKQRMLGPGYDIPDVPWVMYFWEDYALHGAYWHNNFGVPMSHGCVHLRPSEAEYLFTWADVGTEVYVHP